MKKNIYFLYILVLASFPQMVKADPSLPFQVQTRISTESPLVALPSCLSPNPNFTCEGQLGHVKVDGHSFFHYVEDNLNCTESYDYTFRASGIVSSEEEISHRVDVEFHNAECSYPKRAINFVQLSTRSLNEALEECVDMPRGDCQFIWKDNSGTLFMGRDYTWSDYRAHQEELIQFAESVRDQQARTNEAIIQGSR